MYLPSPASTLNWDAAYEEDPDTNKIIRCLFTHKSNSIPQSVITGVSEGYKIYLNKGLIGMAGGN